MNEFIADELPSSLEILDLSSNEITSFTLSKPLKSLTKLDLSRNHLTTLRLDLNQIPNIQNISLSDNGMKSFLIIDNPRHSVKELYLERNDIVNARAYKWINYNKDRTNILLHNSLPQH